MAALIMQTLQVYTLHYIWYLLDLCLQGGCVSVGVTSLTISAMLKDANGSPADGLYGNTTIPFQSCWANYTDLAINTTGDGACNLPLLLTVQACQLVSFCYLFASY